MAAMSYNASHPQQQQLMDAVNAGMLQQMHDGHLTTVVYLRYILTGQYATHIDSRFINPSVQSI